MGKVIVQLAKYAGLKVVAVERVREHRHLLASLKIGMISKQAPKARESLTRAWQMHSLIRPILTKQNAISSSLSPIPYDLPLTLSDPRLLHGAMTFSRLGRAPGIHHPAQKHRRIRPPWIWQPVAEEVS